MTDETSSPPPAENLVLRILREMRAEMNGRFDKVEQRFNKVDDRFDGVEQRLARLESGVEEIGFAVAALTVSNRHIRADANKILANQDNHETRIKAIETR